MGFVSDYVTYTGVTMDVVKVEGAPLRLYRHKGLACLCYTPGNEVQKLKSFIMQ